MAFLKWFFFVVALFNYSSNATLVIIAQNDSNNRLTAIAEGSDVVLNCSSTATEKIKRIEWFKDGHLTKTQMVIRPVSTLKLQNVMANETNGVYKCVAWMDNGRNQSTWYSLRVDERPIVYLRGGYVKISSKTQSKTLSCFIKAGWPKPYVRWNTPSGIVVNKTNLVIDLTRKPKEIRGSYACYASNRAGAHHKKIYVDIEDTVRVPRKPLKIIPNNRTVMGYHGDSVSLKMKAHNTPNPQVMSATWSFRDKELERGHKYNISMSFYKTADGYETEIILTVKNLTVNDSGTYYLTVQTNAPPEAKGYRKLEVQDNNPVSGPTMIYNTTHPTGKVIV